MADFYTLLTNAGIAYENACKAAGQPIKLSQVSVGDGNGAVYNPAATDTALKREVWRGPLNALFQDEQNPSWLLAEVTIPPEEGGFYVREAGIWTDTGILYAIVKYPESFKPVLATSGSGKEFYIRSIFETSNAAIVTLLIDDTVVKATRAWVMGYLADELAKLDGKQSVRVATTGNIVLSGAQQIDGVAVVSGQRVLVAAQAAAKDNGIYVAANGAWVRSADSNASAKVTPGLTVMVEEGTANGDSLWHLVTNGPITLDTTALTFEMLAGRTGIQAGTYKSLTVDKYGRVTSGTNPTTVAGYGITDAVTKPLIVPVTASKALAVNELGVVLIDATAAAVTVTLPAADASLGVRDVIVRRTDNGGNRLVIQAAGTDKVKFHTHLRSEGYPFFVLMGAGDYWHLRSDGAGSWLPIARFDGTPLGRPVLETTTAFSPGGWAGHNGFLYSRAEWPWTWDHAQASGMLTTEALRTGKEGCWTSGDGASTFRSPEARGEFMRMLDESRGIDASRVAGSSQIATAVAIDAVTSTNIAKQLTTTAYKLSASPDYNAMKVAVGGDPLSESNYPGVGVTIDGGDGAGVAYLTSAANFINGSLVGARPRNIAYPGRLKMI
jgi:phage-related tail fiber protein